jgi:plastocyanin
MRARFSGYLAAFALTVAGCGGGDSYGSGPNENPGGGGSTSTTVTVRNNVFDPSATTVAVGATVSWTWAQGAVDHNVTFDDGPKSATQASGGFARTFATAGTYPYRCTQHPAMTGTVTVR